jgi:flagellar motility protein MotE (MotC chaperone)
MALVGRVRILPLIIIVSALVLGLHVMGLLTGHQPKGTGVSAALAAGDDEEKKESKEEKVEAGPVLFTRAEVDQLQALQNRREELDAREKEMGVQEDLLKVTEKRIEEKIAELKKIESTIQSLLKKHDAQEEKKLQSLVKMYEAMKPKDAARIFESLEMNILIQVVERMKERRVAPVMAAMQSEAAKRLTTELATRNHLPKRDGG